MRHEPVNGQSYRLVVRRRNGEKALCAALFQSRSAAESHLQHLLRVAEPTQSQGDATLAREHTNGTGANDFSDAEVVLQCGVPAERLMFDPLRVIPGERGGWSRLRWEALRVWPSTELHDLRAAVAREFSAFDPKAQRTAEPHAPSRAQGGPTGCAAHKSYRWHIVAGVLLPWLCWFVAVVLLMLWNGA